MHRLVLKIFNLIYQHFPKVPSFFIIGVQVFGYPILSFMVYPFAGTPYDNALAVCSPYALRILDPASVIVSYFSRASRELASTAPCTPNLPLFGL